MIASGSGASAPSRAPSRRIIDGIDQLAQTPEIATVEGHHQPREIGDFRLIALGAERAPLL